MLKKYFWFRFLGLLLPLNSCTNHNTFETVKNGKSLLWEVSGKNLAQPSYILGTMHLMCAEDATLSTNVIKLIKQVDTVYLEVDLDNASELLSEILNLRSEQGYNLREALSPNDYDKVRSFFKRYQPRVPFTVLENQPPLMLSSAVYDLLLPCEKKNGIELKIVDEAYHNKKETQGLETIAYQAALFDSIPFADQAKELVNTIDSLSRHKLMMEQMINAYKQQDIEKLHDLSTSEDSGVSNFLDLLLYRRNRNWAAKFPEITANSSVLIAVGAGHLGGDKGVLHLLKEAGYSIRPLEN